MQSLNIIAFVLIIFFAADAAKAQHDVGASTPAVRGTICVDPTSGEQRLLPVGESDPTVCAPGENSFVAISVEQLAAPPPQIQPFNRDMTALPDEAADDGAAVP